MHSAGRWAALPVSSAAAVDLLARGPIPAILIPLLMQDAALVVTADLIKLQQRSWKDQRSILLAKCPGMFPGIRRQENAVVLQI